MTQQMGLFEQHENAQRRMEQRFASNAGMEQVLFDKIAKTVIVDKLVAPTAMRFLRVGGEAGIHLYFGADHSSMMTIHRHALNQMAAKVSLPMTYVNTLLVSEEWKRDLLTYNFNELFHQTAWPDRQGTPRFLFRVVDNELRGFLSRRFNRYTASAPLLRAFIDQCTIEGARPIEASSSPVRSSLKCLLSTVFEVFPGEYICVGVEWSNSDFGAGKMKVLQTIWRVGTGTAAVLDEGLARAHIGSIIEESDVEMSDDTAKKEVLAQQGAVKDHVKEFLSPKTIDRITAAIRAARDQQIPWGQLRGRLRDVLNKSDLDWLQNVLDKKGESIIDLPPISFAADGTPMPNTYWAASAVSAIAAKTEDPDRKLDLQREAGKLLAAALEKP